MDESTGGIVLRPDDLPDFSRPPLNEVVLGVQFDPPQGYQQIRAGEVWGLFKADFPEVQELPPLPPNFETFGLSQPNHMNFGIVTGASHDRFWFLSEKGTELIQFQNDRLLHNWRKVSDSQQHQYPRFETIADKFIKELRKFEEYINKLQVQELIIRQCEISYVNHIRPWPGEKLNASDWLRFINPENVSSDEFSASFRRTILIDGKPKGRLTCESATAIDEKGERFILLTLTARGIPERTDPTGALEFINKGRDMIVRAFAEITTDSAHKRWERTH